jgi:hypothetical protein
MISSQASDWITFQHPLDTVESEGRQIMQCWIKYFKEKSSLPNPGRKELSIKAGPLLYSTWTGSTSNTFLASTLIRLTFIPQQGRAKVSRCRSSSIAYFSLVRIIESRRREREYRVRLVNIPLIREYISVECRY